MPPIYHNGKMYVRFSAQVYNELEDYQVGIDAVNEALDIFSWRRLKRFKTCGYVYNR